MTEARLKELEAICESATPGPWRVALRSSDQRVDSQDKEGVWWRLVELTSFERNDGDISFIAASRTAIPEPVVEIRRLKHVISLTIPGKLTL